MHLSLKAAREDIFSHHFRHLRLESYTPPGKEPLVHTIDEFAEDIKYFSRAFKFEALLNLVELFLKVCLSSYEVVGIF
jgi:hypothetical protein